MCIGLCAVRITTAAQRVVCAQEDRLTFVLHFCCALLMYELTPLQSSAHRTSYRVRDETAWQRAIASRSVLPLCAETNEMRCLRAISQIISSCSRCVRRLKIPYYSQFAHVALCE
jgi:hypothetical protein